MAVNWVVIQKFVNDDKHSIINDYPEQSFLPLCPHILTVIKERNLRVVKRYFLLQLKKIGQKQ